MTTTTARTAEQIRAEQDAAWEAHQGTAWHELNAGPRASTRRANDETEEKAA